MNRREWLATGMMAMASPLIGQDQARPKWRQVTHGPKFHWFGYYDKLQFDPTSRYLLGMQVGFEHRSPKSDDGIKIGMVDLKDGDRWIELGKSRAWCWQQGCMLQWIPGSKREVIWNDRDGDLFVSRILNVESKQLRTIKAPVYALSPDGQSAIAADFRRLNDVRPGYGYAGIPDPSLEMAPKESGIWTVDLNSGEQKLILSIAQVAAFGEQTPDMIGAKHWFNHLLYNTDGTRFVFLHRWRPKGKQGFKTRMLTANLKGEELFTLDPSGETSHFIWRDSKSICAWTRPKGMANGFYLFEDKTTNVEQIGKGVMTENGHNTYLPGNEWILNDTYPDKERLQHVYLYHVKSGKRVPLGDFKSPVEYAQEWRCDTHPRFSPDGKLVCIDSPHEGGRQMFVVDVGAVVK